MQAGKGAQLSESERMKEKIARHKEKMKKLRAEKDELDARLAALDAQLDAELSKREKAEAALVILNAAEDMM